MIPVLDPQLPEFDRYRVGLYREDGKLADMMDMIMSDQRGEDRLRQWMQPHAVNTTCAIVDQEMDLVKARLTVLMNHITPNFISSWSLKSTTGQAANELAPVPFCVLEHAAKSDRAQSRNKKMSSQQVRTIIGLRVSTYCYTVDMLCHRCTTVKSTLSPQHQFPGHFRSILELQWLFAPDNKCPS
jgi:hypothetical protein